LLCVLNDLFFISSIDFFIYSKDLDLGFV
jgi:hypothetical protein